MFEDVINRPVKEYKTPDDIFRDWLRETQDMGIIELERRIKALAFFASKNLRQRNIYLLKHFDECLPNLRLYMKIDELLHDLRLYQVKRIVDEFNKPIRECFHQTLKDIENRKECKS